METNKGYNLIDFGTLFIPVNRILHLSPGYHKDTTKVLFTYETGTHSVEVDMPLIRAAVQYEKALSKG